MLITTAHCAQLHCMRATSHTGPLCGSCRAQDRPTTQAVQVVVQVGGSRMKQACALCARSAVRLCSSSSNGIPHMEQHFAAAGGAVVAHVLYVWPHPLTFASHDPGVTWRSELRLSRGLSRPSEVRDCKTVYKTSTPTARQAACRRTQFGVTSDTCLKKYWKSGPCKQHHQYQTYTAGPFCHAHNIKWVMQCSVQKWPFTQHPRPSALYACLLYCKATNN